MKLVRICKECGKEFEVNKITKRFCNKKCYASFYQKQNGYTFYKRSREYFLENREKIKDSRRAIAKSNKEKAVELLGGKCLDCKGEFPLIVYDFHHLNIDEKDINIGKLLRHSWENIEKELKKCVLLCANCHRIRHLKEYNNNNE